MNRYYMHGPVYGIVSANQDPDKLGRVKVKLEMLGEGIETDWVPVMTLASGIMAIPELNDQVVVAFMGDCSDHPVVLGGLWSNVQLPPETGENTESDLNQDGENNLRFIKSRSGHMLIFDDKEGEEKLQVIAADGKSRYEFSVKDENITFKTDFDVLFNSEAGQGFSSESISISASETVTLEGDQVSVENMSKNVAVKSSQNGVDVEGTSVKLN